MLEIELQVSGVNPGWTPASRVDADKVLRTVYALIQYVAKNHDMDKLYADLSVIKFDHWAKLIQYPVYLLTGFDPMERSNHYGKMADADDMFEIISVLDNAYSVNNEEDITDQPCAFFDTNEGLSAALVARNKSKNTFARSFSGLAKELDREYRYGDYILKRTGDRSTNGRQNLFSLINTSPKKPQHTATIVQFKKKAKLTTSEVTSAWANMS